MLKYIIRISVFACCVVAFGQKQLNLSQKDTVRYNEEYGLRVGVDLSRLVLSYADEDYQGIEFVGDYRITQKLFLAAELGNEKRTRFEDLYNYTSSGSYIKLGVDLNNYANWKGEQNFITFGGRYAFSTFSKTLNDYKIFDSNRYFNPDDFVQIDNPAEEFTGLNASWLEMVLGLKAELFANFYIGITGRLAFIVSDKASERFDNKNLWIPGFNRVTDNARWGLGYNYSISYFIPLYRKAKKKKETEKQPQQPVEN